LLPKVKHFAESEKQKTGFRKKHQNSFYRKNAGKKSTNKKPGSRPGF
jgi:hypothetical protein